MRVVLYTVSHECPLCDEVRAHLTALRRHHAFTVEEVLVDRDPRLAVRYALRVPVVEVDGREVGFGKVDPRALQTAVSGGGTVAPRS
ncbi:MAG: glutaredoxin family protein [Planctomycetes bacterium]|nr:glutaredoxin family protein [Planctomycetota bacterium]